MRFFGGEALSGIGRVSSAVGVSALLAVACSATSESDTVEDGSPPDSISDDTEAPDTVADEMTTAAPMESAVVATATTGTLNESAVVTTTVVSNMGSPNERYYAVDVSYTVDVDAVAPSWPFRGVVNVVRRPSTDRSWDEIPSEELEYVLQYWNADTGDLTEVFLADRLVTGVDAGVRMVCPAHFLMSVSTSGVEIAYGVDWQSEKVFWIPWGGRVETRSELTNFRPEPDPQRKDVLVDRQGTVGDHRIVLGSRELTGRAPYNPWIFITDGIDERYYAVFEYPEFDPGYDADTLDPTLLEGDGSLLGYLVTLGTDGGSYGLLTASTEPACTEDWAWMVSADTGKVLACGWTVVAPSWVLPDSRRQEFTELTIPEESFGRNIMEKCPGKFDLTSLKNPIERSTDLIIGAPSLPFRGIINYYEPSLSFIYGPARYRSTDIKDPYPFSEPGLHFWNAADSSSAYVLLSKQSRICGPGFMIARSDGVEIGYVDNASVGWTVLQVPWGDEAYPSFIYSREILSRLGLSAMRIGEELVVEEVKVDAGVFKFSTSQEARFYGIDYNRGLRDLGSEYSKDDVPDPLPAWETDAFSEMVGTDGHNYAFRIVFHEPVCSPQRSFIVAGDTGELLTCGWSYLGPILVDLYELHEGITDPVFPVLDPPEREDSCDQVLDLRNLSKNAGEHIDVDPDGSTEIS